MHVLHIPTLNFVIFFTRITHYLYLKRSIIQKNLFILFLSSYGPLKVSDLQIQNDKFTKLQFLS